MPKSSQLTLASIKTLLKQELKAQRKEIVDTMFKHFATKDDLKELKTELSKKIGHLPTKEEYYAKMDQYIKETQASRQENAVLPQQVADLKDRVDKIEDHLGLATS